MSTIPAPPWPTWDCASSVSPPWAPKPSSSRTAATIPPVPIRLLRRLNGVLVVRDYVLLGYGIKVHKLATAAAIAFGKEGPRCTPELI